MLNTLIGATNIVKGVTDFEELSDKMEELERNLINLKKSYNDLTKKEDTLLHNLETRILHLKHIEDHLNNGKSKLYLFHSFNILFLTDIHSITFEYSQLKDIL